MTRPRPYHHGNLRDALLDAAERSIKDLGVEQLSLRELARTAGVSHAAPRAHFPDRQALLEALAERGFVRLGTELHDAYQRAQPTFAARLRAMMTTHVGFARRNPALLELMFAMKARGDALGLQSAAADVLSTAPRLVEEGITAGELESADPSRHALLLAATVRGIVGVVTSDNVPPDAVDELIADAATTFIQGNAPRR